MAVVGNQPARFGFKFINGDDFPIIWQLRDYESKAPVDLDLCAIDFTLSDNRGNPVLELSLTNGRLTQENGVIKGIISKEETAEVLPKKGLWVFSITSQTGCRKTLANGPTTNNAPGRINDTEKRISAMRVAGNMEWAFLPGEVTPPANDPMELYGEMIGAANSSDAYPPDTGAVELFEARTSGDNNALSEQSAEYARYYSGSFE